MNFRPYWSYLKYLLRHKLGVLKWCWKFGLFWQGIIHDLSKFSPAEFGAYARHFYDEKGAQKPIEDHTDLKFDLAWLQHIHQNPHHWQYWILLEDNGPTKVLPMSDLARKEMLADWLSFGAQREWYSRNKGKMILHPETRAWIEVQLGLEEEGSSRYQRPVKTRYKRASRIRR